MIRSAKPWRARSRALRSSRTPDVRLEGREVGELAKGADEVLVELRQDLLAQLANLDREVGLLAGQLGLGVVLREGDVELGRAADLEADEVRLEARDQALLAEDQRHPLRRAALERDAVARAVERNDRVVTVLRAAALDSRQRRILVAQLLDHLVDPGVVDRVDLRREVEVLVVAERHLGADLDGRLEDERLALLGLDDLHIGVRQGQNARLEDGFAIGVLDQVFDGLVGHRARVRGGARGRVVGPCRDGSRAPAPDGRGGGRHR